GRQTDRVAWRRPHRRAVSSLSCTLGAAAVRPVESTMSVVGYTSLGPEDMRVVLDERPATLRIGLLVLSTDHTTERDFRRVVTAPGIGVYTNRVPYSNPLNAENLRAMRPHLREAAALILPDEPVDALAFS